jgi:hypothetical protein
MSLLAALRNKTFSCATAIPAIRAIPDESRIAQIAQIAVANDEAMPPHQSEVVDMLRSNPVARYAFTTRTEGNDVILTLAVRGVAVADWAIPAEKYDAFELLKMFTSEVSQ